jgi:hypothetical protein
LPDFLGIERLEKKILGTNLSEYYDSKPTLDEMLVDALEYYREHCPEVKPQSVYPHPRPEV